MQDSKTMSVLVVVAIFMGGAGFFGGTLYQKSVTPASVLGGRPGGNTVGRNFGGGGMGFRPVVGEILSRDDKSITVKLTDGSSKIVLFSGTTLINKAEKVEASVLVVGELVRVFGATNPDGSITAQDIQLNPEQSQRGQGQ